MSVTSLEDKTEISLVGSSLQMYTADNAGVESMNVNLCASVRYFAFKPYYWLSFSVGSQFRWSRRWTKRLEGS